MSCTSVPIKEIVYIGQGLRGRSKHCNSGCSHVYSLNKIHFLEGSEALTTTVIGEYNSATSVLEKEKELIKKFRPQYNTVHMNTSSKLLSMQDSKNSRKALLEFGKGKLSESSHIKYKVLNSEFFSYYTMGNVVAGDFTILSPEYYKAMGLISIARLSRFLRDRHLGRYSSSNYNQIFTEALNEVLSVDILKLVTTI